MTEDMICYRIRKLIYNIIFNFYENKYEDDSDVFDLIVVESLKNIVEYFVSKNYLSERVKENILNYLMQAREYEDENKTKRIEFINDIIGFINSQKEDDSLIFYRLELFKRRKDYKYLLKITDSEIKKEIEAVHDSICHDLYMLVSHTDITSEEEFETDYLPYFKNSDLYYESLNAMLSENPGVFKDKVFYERTICVLNLNNELYNNDRKIVSVNKKLVKQINKKIRKIK